MCWLCGTESGRYVALDLGGTNFRVLMIELKGRRDEAPDVVSKVFLIPLRIMLGTAQMASHSFTYKTSTLSLLLMGDRKIFSRGGQIKGLGTKVPQGWSPSRGLWTKPPEADDRL